MYKVYLAIALFIAAFFSGYQTSNWHHDSLDLVAQKAVQKSAEEFKTDQMSIADNVTKSLNEWKQNNVQIQEKIIREKLQPVFLNKCVTDDYVRLFNQQTAGKQGSGSGEPSAKTGNQR